jgi:aminoglycoside phosphotransferase (APT) family kinase protein
MEPNAEMAAAIATRVIGRVPATVRRFTTGSQHYVFDVAFPGWPSVVVRIGSSSAQAPMAGALYLSGMLRPRGVPLPKILAEDIRGEFPWLLMERLPGTDLGARINCLSDQQLDRIAAGVVCAQAITATTGSAGRYGYAARPEQAPHAMWAQVLDASFARSRQRMVRAGLFDVALVDMAQGALAALRDEIDQIAPTPFLHDTTIKNVIVTADGDLSGIVDVDDLCFGDPRYPAALTRAVLLAYGGPVRYVSFWSRHAGWSADDRVFRFYVTVFLLDLMAEHGQAFNGNERPSSPQVRAHLWQAFKSSLELVMS